MRKSSPALPTNPNSICPADALPVCFPGWAAFFACRSPSPWDRQWLPRRKAFARRCGDEATWGAIAQLGERYNGIVEVSGSIPLSSTNLINTNLITLAKLMAARLMAARFKAARIRAARIRAARIRAAKIRAETIKAPSGAFFMSWVCWCVRQRRSGGCQGAGERQLRYKRRAARCLWPSETATPF